MHNKTTHTHPYRLLLLLALLSVTLSVLAAHPLAAQTATVITLYVDTQHTDASDNNPGTQDRPFQTIGAALRRAQKDRASGQEIIIRIADGTYREQINSVLGDGSPITIEAITPGKAIISGSDIWGGWQDVGDGTYTHAWPYDWGEELNPWAAAGIDVAPLVRRHELVVVNGTLLRQVLAPSELVSGTFTVDESADRITIRPSGGIDIAQATVEVGVRLRLFQVQRGSNLTIRGLTFQHSTEALDHAAVWFINLTNLLIEDCTFQWNNAVGLKLNTSTNVTVRRSISTHNGMDGMGADEMRNLLLEDTVTSYNNWRGDWGGFYIWSIGQKFMHIHGAVIRRHQSIGNQTRGFWLDTDNADIVIEDSIFRNNRRDGLFIEANNGPITVRNSIFAHNQDMGLFMAHSRDLTLEGNQLCSNLIAQLGITGTGTPRQITNWETAQVLDVFTEHITLNNNTAVGSGGQFLFHAQIPESPWQQFVTTFSANSNHWYHESTTKAFRMNDGKVLDVKGWQGYTGQDANATTGEPAEPACANKQLFGSEQIFLPTVSAPN
jgi:hypothetical protein